MKKVFALVLCLCLLASTALAATLPNFKQYSDE